MIGYNTLSKSMNGVKVLTDGISFISDGNAQHDNIIYNDYIKSETNETTLTNNSLDTTNITCDSLTANNFMATNIDAENIEGNYLIIKNKTTNNTLMTIDGITNNNIVANVPLTFNNQLNLVNYDLRQTQAGRIYQQGTNNNYLKDTYINGYLQLGSNLTQLGGSSSLKDLTIDNLTLRENKSITQTGATVSNSLAGTTTIKDLIILNSVVFPSSVTVPGTTTTDDIVMEGDSVITQDLTTATTKKNLLRNTKTLDLDVDGNLTQIKGGSTATLKNTTIQGTAEIQGDITQTSGTTILKTLRCNNITLNDDQIITQSGTGYLIQSGTGQNVLKEISLLSNANLIFNGSGIINQPLNGTNILSHFRSAGFGIIGGRNNTTYTNYQNIQNNNGLQIQFNRDNSTQYSFLMNNRGTGGNGGFRFQRYIGGIYLDEPLIIDDNITMNKNVSIPAGSITCSSATIGNISQSELNCLDNCAQNINDKFISLDSQISSIQSAGNNNSTALTGISYVSASDTTFIDNNVTISSGKNLTVGTTNIINAINSINSTLSGISYDSSQDITTINNHVLLPTGNNFFLGSGYNVKTNIDDCINKLSGITYASGTDTTTIDNNLTVNKTLIVQGMNIKAEIDALDSSFTTGTINSTDLTTNNLYVNNDAKFGQVGGTTYIKNDMRFCNTTNKSEGEFTQVYQGGSQFNLLNHRPSGTMSFQIKNSGDTALVEYMKLNSTSLNVKNTNVDIDTNLNVDGTTTLQNATVNNVLTVSNGANVTNSLNVTNGLITCPNYITSVDFTEKETTTLIGGSAPTVDVASFTITQPFSKDINVELELSGGAKYQTTGNVGSTINRLQLESQYSALNVYIYKNGTLFQSNVSYFSPQSQYTINGFPFIGNTFIMDYISAQNYIQFYLGTIKFKFTPDYQNIGDTNVYSVRIAFSLSFVQFSNFNVQTGDTSSIGSNLLSSQMYMFSNVVYPYNGTVQSLIKCGSPATYKYYPLGPGFTGATTYSIDYTVNRNFLNTSEKKEVQFNIINSNSAYISNANIPTASMTTATITNATITKAKIDYTDEYFKSKCNIAGYLFNGNLPYLAITPIVCSMRGMLPDNADDYFIVNPGYKLSLYRDGNYSNLTQELENDDIVPKPFTPNPINTTSSIKVWYRNKSTDAWKEIYFIPISYASPPT